MATSHLSGGPARSQRWCLTARPARGGQESARSRFLALVTFGSAAGSHERLGFTIAALSGIGMVLSMGTQVLIARRLGVEEFGHYLYVLAIAGVLSLVIAFDLGGAALRYIGLYRFQAEFGKVRSFCAWAGRVVILTGAVSGLLVALGQVGGLWSVGQGWLQLSLLAPLLALIRFESVLMQALERPGAGLWPNSVLRPVVIGFVFWLAIGAGAAPTSETALWVVTGVLFAVAVVTRLARAGAVREIVGDAPSSPPLPSEWLKYSAILLAGSLIQLAISTQSDVVIVGSILSAREAGLYGTAAHLAGLVGMVTTAFLVGVSARLSGAIGTGDWAHARSLVRSTGRIISAFGGVALAGLIVFGPAALRVFGREFDAASGVLAILALVNIVGALSGGMLSTLLNCTGNVGLSSTLNALAAGVNLGLGVFLSLRYGIEGMALASLVAAVLRAAMLALAVRQRLGCWVVGWWMSAAFPERLGRSTAA